jgi:pSer/pThr/pTyr-binding forkhead associated (FHA) protein
VIIGRDPVANAAWPTAALLPALDPAKSLSKTHAVLELEGGILWVHDLDSTNGVFVAAPGVDVVQVDPGSRVVVPDGAEIELGEFIVTVLRA